MCWWAAPLPAWGQLSKILLNTFSQILLNILQVPLYNSFRRCKFEMTGNAGKRRDQSDGAAEPTGVGRHKRAAAAGKDPSRSARNSIPRAEAPAAPAPPPPAPARADARAQPAAPRPPPPAPPPAPLHLMLVMNLSYLWSSITIWIWTQALKMQVFQGGLHCASRLR